MPHVRVEERYDELPEAGLKYLLDSAFFEFCKRHPASRMAFQVGNTAFWEDDPDSMHTHADHGNAETLAREKLDAPSATRIEAMVPNDDRC